MAWDSWQEATVLPTKHRARATTYWQQRADGRPHAYGGNGWQHGTHATVQRTGALT